MLGFRFHLPTLAMMIMLPCWGIAQASESETPTGYLRLGGLLGLQHRSSGADTFLTESLSKRYAVLRSRKSQPGGGEVALGIHAPGPFQIELSAIMLGPTSTMFGSDPRYGTSGYAMRSTIRTSSALMLSGLWHALQVGRWNWHLEGGFGYAHHRYRLDYWQPTGITQKNRRESGIAYQIGTGLRYHATDTIFWQLGYRFMQMGKINVPGWMIDPHLISRDYRLTSHQISVSLGIRW